MSDSSTRLALPYLASSQAQKHITVNESLSLLDALIGASARDRDIASPPSDPEEGDCYLVAEDGTGAWSGWDDDLAMFRDGAWHRVAPPVGALVFVEDEDRVLVRRADGWAGAEAALDAVTSGDAASGSLLLLGVNTAADASNRLAVKANAALFSHDDATPGTGDMRVTLNKSIASKSAELVFQTNFVGHAALGLAGADNFSLKVSADGSIWTTALSVNRTNGYVSMGRVLISDNIEVSGDTWRTAQVTVAANSAWAQFKGRRARGSIASPAAVQALDTIYAFTPEAHDGTAYVQAGGFDFIAETNFSSAKNAFFRLATLDSGSWAEKLRVAANGNVGIGLTAPVTKLDVDGPIKPKSFSVAGVPAASGVAGALIYVNNESGGAVMAFSDGSNWRRVTDRAIIS